MNDFLENYSKYTITELLRVIDNPNDYVPLAVETAKSIHDLNELFNDIATMVVDQGTVLIQS